LPRIVRAIATASRSSSACTTRLTAPIS
jgi:hypothetical protein